MKKILFLFLAVPTLAIANCNNYVVGFKGLHNAFDKEAFVEYATKKSSCYKLYTWQQVDEAVNFVNNTNLVYEFYGFSKGAESVAIALTKVKQKPKYIVTVGAWHTTDVDFRKYNIKFTNFFDESGKKQQSPGIHISKVPHMKMQQHINELMPHWTNW